MSLANGIIKYNYGMVLASMRYNNGNYILSVIYCCIILFSIGVLSMGPKGETTNCKLVELYKVGNIFAIPALNNIYTLPWLGHGSKRVGSVCCELVWPNTSPIKATPRYVVKQQLHHLEEMDFQIYSAFEFEFID